MDFDREKSETGSCEPYTDDVTLRVEVVRLAMLDTRMSTAIDFAEHFESDVE
jgi:hypothetical protein